MKNKSNKKWKPRVVIPRNTGTIVHKDKKTYNRKVKHKNKMFD